MASLSEFLKSPTVAFVNGCKKDQLTAIADHYDIVVGKGRKDEIRRTVLDALFDQGVLHKGETEAGPDPLLFSVPAGLKAGNLTFEQQKELLVLQFEQEKLRRQMEIDEKLELR